MIRSHVVLITPRVMIVSKNSTLVDAPILSLVGILAVACVRLQAAAPENGLGNKYAATLRLDQRLFTKASTFTLGLP